MLHGSETWPVKKENGVALQRAEMRMVRWICNVPSKELRERLGSRNRWYVCMYPSGKGPAYSGPIH